MPIRILKCVAVTLASLSAMPSLAHEFWVEPEEFFVQPDEVALAALRVGQEFNGASMVYLSRNFTRFDFALGDDVQPVEGETAQRPAFQVEMAGEGLGIILHETRISTLDYDEWDRFLAFAEHKDFGDIEPIHLARGLPLTDFTESYSRHVKSLIAVGNGAGEDREFGLVTEFVALANPYTDDLTDGMPVQLYFDGMTFADRQVELFDRAPDGDVTITLHRTNEEGIALLPVEPGHIYMADAVTLAPVEPIEAGPVWHTFWANLTFMVPEE